MLILLWNIFPPKISPLLRSYFPVNYKYWLCKNGTFLCNANFFYPLLVYQSKIGEQHSEGKDGLKGYYPSQRYLKQIAFNYTSNPCGVRGYFYYLLFSLE